MSNSDAEKIADRMTVEMFGPLGEDEQLSIYRGTFRMYVRHAAMDMESIIIKRITEG